MSREDTETAQMTLDGLIDVLKCSVDCIATKLVIQSSILVVFATLDV